MSYTSFKFFILVAATALVYFLFPKKKYQWTVLLAASYVFYLFAGYKYIAFILFTTVCTFLSGLWSERVTVRTKEFIAGHKDSLSRDEKKKLKEKAKLKKRWILAMTLVVNFGILAFLKYYNFFSGSINGILRLFPSARELPLLRLVLPLGISFYTFQSMGYLVDVYRETVKAERNPFKFALFVSFFPQIVQGPIGIYSDLAHQLYEPHRFDFTRMKHAALLVLWGMFKKLVIADRAIIAINAVTDNYASFNGTTLTFTVILYSLQLYADFSGGIDISRGVSKFFGIELMENFRRPYFAKDISEYWRRWHISLGNWFKNYLFYPMAMSKQFNAMSKGIKKSKFGATKAGTHIAKVLPTSIASFFVFLMVGVWHGANWKYIAFGVYNGLIIMLSVLMKPVFDWTLSKLRINPESKPYALFRMVRTYLLVLVGYVFDVAPTFSDAMMTFRRFFTNQGYRRSHAEISQLGLDIPDYVLLLICTVVIFIVSVWQERHTDTTVSLALDRRRYGARFACFFFLIMTVILFGIYGSGYNPTDFVYMQF